MLWLLLTHERSGCTKDFLRRQVDDYVEAETNSAFERKFTRDKQLLRDVGIPLISSAAAGIDDVGLRTDTTYFVDQSQLYLPRIAFTAAEEQALAYVSGLWSDEHTRTAIGRALSRLRQYPESEETGSPTGRGSAISPTSSSVQARLVRTDELVTAVAEAARQRQFIAFSYHSVDATGTTRRRVRAWNVLAAAGHWYLTGWDLDRRARRTFRLSRIVSSTVYPTRLSPTERQSLEADSLPPADFDAAHVREQVLGQGTQRTAVLRLRPGAAHRLRVLGTVTDEADGGWDRLTAAYTRPRHFAGLVAASGQDVTVEDYDSELAALVIDALHRGLTAQQQPAPEVELKTPPKARNRASDADVVARLLDMITLLNQHPDGMDRDELIRRLGTTSTRLDHDLHILSFCGLPERMAPGEQFDVIDYGDTVRLRQAEQLADPLRLSTPEALAMVSGLQVVAGFPGLDSEIADGAVSAQRKIRELTPPGADDAVDASVDVDPALAEKVEPLHQAITEQRSVDVDYYTVSRHALSHRRLDPMRLVYSEQGTYLQAWCHQAAAVRNFRVDRMGPVAATDRRFTPRVTAEELPSIRTTTDTADAWEATVWFSYRLRDLMQHYTPAQTGNLADGSVIGHVQIRDTATACSLVAEHAGEVAIMQPEALASHVTDWLKNTLTHHQLRPMA